jgi:hypothetical protein
MAHRQQASTKEAHMQFLVTVNDPENGLGSGTERAFTDQITEMVGMWDRFPDVTATIEVHEEDVYVPEKDGTAEYVPMGYEGWSAVVVPTCDYCGRAQGDSPNVLRDDQPADWNPETGNHRTCEPDFFTKWLHHVE